MQLELCIYSQDTVEDCSQTSFLDITQSSQSNGTNTPVKSSENEQQMDGSQICQCGKGTLDCSIHPSTREKWIASMQDSLARIYRSLEKEVDWEREQEAASTVKSFALQARYDHESSSWKTSQQFLLTDLEQSLEIWPRWGWMHDGAAYAHRMSGRNITETDGFYFPTATTQDNPQVRGVGKTIGTNRGTTLGGFVRMWPTPTANEDAAGTPKGKMQAMLANHPDIRGRTEKEWATGTLNPTWVEWLMGFPIGFTVLKVSEMPKPRYRQQSPTVCSEVSE